MVANRKLGAGPADRVKPGAGRSMIPGHALLLQDFCGLYSRSATMFGELQRNGDAAAKQP